jgi:hypothetical protein
MTDISTIATMAVLAGGIIYVSAMYFYRRITAGETFSLEKYAQTFGYIALVSVAAYIATSALPDFDSILTQVTASGGTGDTGTILALLTTVGAWLYKHFTSTSAATATTTAQTVAGTTAAKSTLAATTAASATVTPAATAQTWSPGLTVTPTFQKGNSPLPISLTVKVGMESATGKRCKVKVDWMDSTPIEIFTADETTGIAVISHTYSYAQGTTQYTGHSFYPEITALSSDGNTAIQSINVDGKCCEIEVQSTASTL